MKLRTRVMITGGVLGALLGVTAAHLYMESNAQVDEEGEEQLPAIQPGKALVVGLAVLQVMKKLVGGG